MPPGSTGCVFVLALYRAQAETILLSEVILCKNRILRKARAYEDDAAFSTLGRESFVQ